MAGARARVPAGGAKEPLTRQRTAWRWPAMEKDETVARRLPKEARDYFGGD